MRHPLFLLLTCLLAVKSYSQIVFEKGYYINTAGEKIDCLIKNEDWKDNPLEFEYKLDQSAEVQTRNIKNTKEFGIFGFSKYIKETVKIDRSSEQVDRLSLSRYPELKNETLFLEVLIEGKASLYSYREGNFKRYFYNIDSSEIEQLIYKNYRTANDQVSKNVQFKQQLLNSLDCASLEKEQFNRLRYRKNNLIKLFKQYNECTNSDFVNYEKNQERDVFNLSLRPRINKSSLEISNNTASLRDTDFGSKTGLGIGVELEYVLPYIRNKWAIAIEPTYQYYRTEKTSSTNNISGGELIAEVQYSSVEIPLSLRHYFFLNQNSKIFVNASLIYDIALETTVAFNRAENSNINSLEIENRTNLAFGLGYKFRDRYGLEVRYQVPRKVLGNYPDWNSDFNTLSLIFGYSIF